MPLRVSDYPGADRIPGAEPPPQRARLEPHIHRRPIRPARRALPPGLPLRPGLRMDERPQRHVLSGRRLAPLLPAQPLRRHVGEHALGIGHEPRPGDVGAPRRRIVPRRVGNHLLRLGRSRSRQHGWFRQGGRPGILHLGGTLPAAVDGLLDRRREEFHQIRRQPGRRLATGRLPRPEGLLVCPGQTLEHDPRRRQPHGDLLLARPQAVETRERLRRRIRRPRRDLGVSRPVRAARRRRPGQHPLGAAFEQLLEHTAVGRHAVFHRHVRRPGIPLRDTLRPDPLARQGTQPLRRRHMGQRPGKPARTAGMARRMALSGPAESRPHTGHPVRTARPEPLHP